MKVLELIEKVNSESEEDYSGPLRQVVVAESELNSYLAFRLEQEEDVLKELRLKLFETNRVEGKILLRFKKTGLSLMLEPEMIFYFSGTIKVKEKAARLAIDELFLNKERVDPLLLDTVIYLASKLQGTEYTGYGLCSLQIFNAILLRFSRLLRNSPRPWVRHTRRPALPDTLEKPHPKAKSSMSLQPQLIFVKPVQTSFCEHASLNFK